jgi:hypothetical protein
VHVRMRLAHALALDEELLRHRRRYDLQLLGA